MNSIEAYINTFPEDVQPILQKIRTIIKEKAPQATEGIAYRMPAYKLNGKPLVYFAGFKNHIGFYARPSGHEKFAKELADYKQGKWSGQFPLDKPIPYNLIGKIIEFRAKENLQKQGKQ